MSDVSPEPASDLDADLPLDLGLDLDLDQVAAAFATHHEAGDVPGIAYGVVHRGRLLHTGGFGTLDLQRQERPQPDSVFRIASMTKSFTALTVLVLRDRGLLRLDDSVAEHLPHLAPGLVGPTSDSADLTIRDLLTMGGGLPTDDPWGDRQQDASLEDFDALLLRGPTRIGPPDGRFEYSNLGFALLGRVITAVTGRSYDEVVAHTILEPLGMADSGFHTEAVPQPRRAVGYARDDDTFAPQPPTGCGAFAPMGGLLSSVRDLARWVGLFAQAEPPRDETDPVTVARRATLREMQQPRRLIEGTTSVSQWGAPPRLTVASYGYGLVIDDDAELGRFVSHSGGYPGFGSHMRWHHGTGLGVVALANRTYAPMRNACATALESLVRPQPRRRTVAWPVTEDAERVVELLLAQWDDALADRWFAHNMDLDLSRQRRREEFARLSDAHGVLRRDTAGGATHDSPAHTQWWLVGDRGRVRVDLLLSPEPEPLIQAIQLLSVPEPAVVLARGARSDAAAAALREVSAKWDRALELDEVGAVVAGDAKRRAVYAMADERLTLQVRLDDDDTLDVRVVPAPQHADGAF